MSKPRYPWWGYARNMIRMYPTRKKELEELRTQSITANNSGMPGAGGVSRGVENIALRELPKSKQRELEAVQAAVDATLAQPNGNLKVKVIELVYWKRSHTLEGAGYYVGYSYKATRKLHGDFVRLVGKCYGFDMEAEEE